MRVGIHATPRPFCPLKRLSTHFIGGCVGLRAGLAGCGKSRPTGIRSPDLPARSESVYRLSYIELHLYVLRYDSYTIATITSLSTRLTT
jgi:hypothetical protein